MIADSSGVSIPQPADRTLAANLARLIEAEAAADAGVWRAQHAFDALAPHVSLARRLRLNEDVRDANAAWVLADVQLRAFRRRHPNVREMAS